MFFYMEVDSETDYVTGWSSTSFSEKEVKMHLPEDHPFFQKFGRYRYKGSMLFEDLSKFLAEAKESKTKELSDACREAIFAGFDHELNGRTYHFSYDAEAQSNFQTTQNLFAQGLIGEARWTVKEDGQYTFIQLTHGEFQGVFLAAHFHKENLVIKLRAELLPVLEKLDSIEAVDEVEWG